MEAALKVSAARSTSTDRPGRRRSWARSASAASWGFGFASLGVGLAVASSLPLVQFIGLGYLLEASGRVAKSGRLRDGIFGVERAGRLGGLAAGAWLATLPLQLVASLAGSAELIDPGGAVARRWRLGLIVLAILTATHLGAACLRGGQLRRFAWPPGNLIWLARRVRGDGLYAEARDATWAFATSLRLPALFRTGLKGFAGTLLWLAVPIALLAMGRRSPTLGVVGALGLAWVVPALPFLQVRFAVEGRFGALFERRAIAERARRAPWAFALGLIVTLAASVPLYLLKIEMIPRELAWLPGLVFVAFLSPARLACGWAYARGGRDVEEKHWASRWPARLGLVPAVLAYVAVVFLAQYTSWGGFRSFAEQHAFLLPVPFGFD